jgi:uncharacterized repeat protein (TIGR01451 family)
MITKRKFIIWLVLGVFLLLFLVSFLIAGTSNAAYSGKPADPPHQTPADPQGQPQGNDEDQLNGSDESQDDDSPPPVSLPEPTPDKPAAPQSEPASDSQPAAKAEAQSTASSAPPAAEPPAQTAAPEQSKTPAEQPASTTTQETEPSPPPPPLCANHPDFNTVPDGWRRVNGSCDPIPLVDMQVSGPSSLSASGGKVSYTVVLKNGGSNLTSGVLFTDQMDMLGSLTPISMTASQGDRCVFDPDPNVRRIYCSIGTIMPGQSATVSITLQVKGRASQTAMVEPGGEAETNTANNSVTGVVTQALKRRHLHQRRH